MDKNSMQPWIDACDCDRYPEGFLTDYEPFECLASSETAETLLVKNKRTGMFYVAKCYLNGHAVSHATESEILKKLHHPGLPRFVDEYQSDEMLCVIREYVEGTPLHQWVGDRRLDAEGAVRIARKLCELMVYLHGQSPPVIHRDIKPQNLILGADGQLWLIDFGISRFYHEEAMADTACWGTQDFAAPEQYGFAQTDVRSDIYSFGILLGWLLTGEVKRESAPEKIADRRLKKIVEKCTAFAPGERYASAVKLRADLEALDGHRRKRLVWRLGAAALCALCLCAGFAAGRFTDMLAPLPAGVAFQEPLIEQTVRQILNKEDGEALTEDDLLSVTELQIFGNQPAVDNAVYEKYVALMTAGTPPPNGGISSLEDLRMMPNLSVLALGLQNISDLTPLANLTALEAVNLQHNPVGDLTPLGQLPRLAWVCLYDTNVRDLSPLTACPRLTQLDIGGTLVTSLESLKGCTSLRALSLFQTALQTLDGVESLTGLTEISLSNVADGDLTPLLSLPLLEAVSLDGGLRAFAENTLADAVFSITYTDE